MTPSRWRRSIRSVRRGLGLPRVKRRSALLIFLLLMGLAYLSATLLSDFFVTVGRYTPRYDEPKGSERR